MTRTYWVLVNEVEGRVLVTGREEDLELLEKGWKLTYESESWREAYAYAQILADMHDYILEWYIEDMMRENMKNRASRNPKVKVLPCCVLN